MRGKERGAFLASGGGTTFDAIGVAIQKGKIKGLDPAVLIVSKRNIGAAAKSEVLRIPWEVADPDDFRGNDGEVDEYGYGQFINRILDRYGVTVVSQNGWLIKTPKNVIDRFPESIFNQHPGPKWETRATKGKQPHAIMLEFSRLTGRNEGTEVIIHRVDEIWDHGATVAKNHVPILEGDTVQSLQERALPYEYALQIDHWNRFLRGEVKEIKDQRYMRPGERYILNEARAKARADFPDG